MSGVEGVNSNCTNNGDCERKLVNVSPCEGDDVGSCPTSHTIFDGAVVRVSMWLIANQLRRVKIPYRPPPSTEHIKKGIYWR